MDKKKRKLKLPESNVEYTFAIAGEISKRVFLYSKTTSSGDIRLYFQDVKDDYVYEDISVWKFNEYIRKHQIIDERKLEKYVAPASVPKVKPTDPLEDIWKHTINRIRNIPETLHANIITIIGYLPEKLVKEMENLDTGGYTKEYEYRVMQNVKRVIDFLDKYELTSVDENTMQKTQVKQVESKTPTQFTKKEITDKPLPTTIIKLLSAISPSMLKKCNTHFGYPISDLIDKFNNLEDKNKSYIESMYKEADRVLLYVGLKKPVMA